MATQAQIDANRRNAAKSTGPRTVNGKRVVSDNALKHGLCSDEAVIKGEDPEVFADFADHLRMSLEEHHLSLDSVLLIERIILLRWKLRRLPRLEKLAMDKLVATHGDGDEAMLAGIVGDPATATLAKLQQYEMRLNRDLRGCMNEFYKAYRTRSQRDCHKSYCEGYNRGVREEAEAKRREPIMPPMEAPAQSLEAVEEYIEDDPDDQATEEMSPDVTACHTGGESAEQSQFAANGLGEQELQAVTERSGLPLAVRRVTGPGRGEPQAAGRPDGSPSQGFESSIDHPPNYQERKAEAAA